MNNIYISSVKKRETLRRAYYFVHFGYSCCVYTISEMSVRHWHRKLLAFRTKLKGTYKLT